MILKLGIPKGSLETATIDLFHHTGEVIQHPRNLRVVLRQNFPVNLQSFAKLLLGFGIPALPTKRDA